MKPKIDRRRALGLFEPSERLVLTLPVFGMFEHDMVRRVGARVLEQGEETATIEFPEAERIVSLGKPLASRTQTQTFSQPCVEWLTRYTVKSINSFRVRVVARENEIDVVLLADPLVGKAHQAAIQTLDELYPGWTDPGAYWS